ncbi:Cation-binding protein [Rubrivivax sp. A210]|uniref:hemerythrin domain-containing protein n=1 Tax=Rubrivivax sp. A210 TaxID=2772301 RepID=UPI0019CD7671|nr:hemerythrin domain-containing protein [Rubrivivax sp. A210]CAD5366346.1 Cation-binding protein [Rubrivivax sp. A210]
MPRQVKPMPSPVAAALAPLQMLSAGHHRADCLCTALRWLVAHLPGHGADAEACEAARALVKHFDEASTLHHADEELDLFPALVESMSGSDAACLRELVEALTREHREMEAMWRRLRPALQAVAEGEARPLAPAEVEPLLVLYARHIAREESELLPLAARLIDDQALERMDRTMRARHTKAR